MSKTVSYTPIVKPAVRSFTSNLDENGLYQFDKAGLFIVGDKPEMNGAKRLYTLAPWVEGAFSKEGKKAYTIAKGSVDPAYSHEDDTAVEQLWKTAIEETFQETGVDLRRIRNPHNPHQKTPEEGFYPGVQIEAILQTPIFVGDLPSNRGFSKTHMMWVVKVKGIEKLAPYLKHADNNLDMEAAYVSRKADSVAKEQGFYRFKDLLGVLRSGVWDLGVTEPVTLYESEFGRMEEAYGKKVKNSQQLDALFETAANEDQRLIKNYLARIRQYMSEHDLVNDGLGLKLGDKHMPLRYYQEGADILPMDEWLDRMIDYAEKNVKYRDTQFNSHVILRPEVEGVDKEKPVQSLSLAGMAYKVAKSLDVATATHRSMDETLALNKAQTSFGTALTNFRMGDRIQALEKKVAQKYDSGADRCVA